VLTTPLHIAGLIFPIDSADLGPDPSTETLQIRVVKVQKDDTYGDCSN
jgi:hypothetical protein